MSIVGGFDVHRHQLTLDYLVAGELAAAGWRCIWPSRPILPPRGGARSGPRLTGPTRGYGRAPGLAAAHPRPAVPPGCPAHPRPAHRRGPGRPGDRRAVGGRAADNRGRAGCDRLADRPDPCRYAPSRLLPRRRSRAAGPCSAFTGWAGCARRSSGPSWGTAAGSPAPSRQSSDTRRSPGIWPARAPRSCAGRCMRRPSAPRGRPPPTTATTPRPNGDGKRPRHPRLPRSRST